MRIAVIVPSLRRTAPIFVAAELCEGFRKRSHEVTLFHLDDIVEFEPEVPRQRLTLRRLGSLATFDVVHSHMLRPDAFAALAACLLRPRARFVSTLHNYVREDLANTHGRLVSVVVSRLWALAWRLMDARVVLSRDGQRYYREAVPAVDFECIPNGRSPHHPAERPVEEHARLKAMRGRYRIVGANAGVSKIKGFEQIVRVLPALPDFAFVLVGNGPELEPLAELARSLHVDDRFVRLGYRSNARDYLDYYDVYVQSSRAEGLPLAMLEAAAAGRSIVCSRIPVFEEVFDERNASFFILDDLEGLRRALLRAWEKRDLLGSAALARFEQCYSNEVMVDGYLALFARLFAS